MAGRIGHFNIAARRQTSLMGGPWRGNRWRQSAACRRNQRCCGQSFAVEDAEVAPRVGFEPTTIRLTVECSTAELSGNAAVLVPSSEQDATLNLRKSASALMFLKIFTLRPGVGCVEAQSKAIRRAGWPRGGMVTQRTANPCIPVRFWARPPLSHLVIGSCARALLFVARCRNSLSPLFIFRLSHD